VIGVYHGQLAWDLYPPNYYIPMSTVISSVPTAEGFVIGSDGRNSTSDPPTILSDDTQKIFSIDRSGMKLAYGLSGTIRIGETMDKVLFDFEPEIIRSVEKIGRRTKWLNYLMALTADLEQSLNGARKASGQTLATEIGATNISIGGFFERSQKLGHIRFEHRIQRSEAEPKNYPDGFSFPFGFQEVLDLVNSGDARFSKYSLPPRIGLTTIAQGVERVRNDILAHYDPEAHTLNETIRWAIGGRVQIATITLADGFRWVPGFEPASASPQK
jgi:hypothetical protein